MSHVPVSKSKPVAGRAGQLPLGRRLVENLSWLAVLELAIAALAAPVLMFPNRLSIVALAAMPLAWLARLIGQRSAYVRTRADLPLFGLLVMTLVGLYASADLSLSQPKLYGLLLGVYLFGLTIHHCRSSIGLQLLGLAIVAGSALVTLAGLFGTSWSADKLPYIGAVQSRMPRLIGSVQTSFGMSIGGFQPNEVGGTLALLVPCIVGLLLFAESRRTRAILALLGAATILTIVLSASRAALLGTPFALIALVVLRWRRLARWLPFGAFALLISVLSIGPARILAWVLTTGLGVGSTGAVRIEIWKRALYAIEDFPLTGVGLNTFPLVINTLYPLLAATEDHIPHAHNFFLQIALDFGLPGLIAFVTLLIVVGSYLVQGWRRQTGWTRGLVAGLAGGLVAHLVYGLFDAVTIGAKPGIFLWLFMGTAVTVGLAPRAVAQATSTGRPLPDRATESVPTPSVSSIGPNRTVWALWTVFTIVCIVGGLIALTGVSTIG